MTGNNFVPKANTMQQFAIAVIDMDNTKLFDSKEV